MTEPRRFTDRDGKEWKADVEHHAAVGARGPGGAFPIPEGMFLVFETSSKTRVLRNPPDDWASRLPELLEQATKVDRRDQ